MRDPRFDILFEPVKIGPVTAPNRFVQVPHCNGTGESALRAVARMREIKAEGGWGIVSTETVEIAANSEFWPFPSLHLWRDDDVKRIAIIPEAIHRHGALAAAELGHIGLSGGNRASRLPVWGPSSDLILDAVEPFQSKSMDLADISNLRRQHRAAARRAKQAGFDVIYAYASHKLSVLSHFLEQRFNRRSDEYGGSLENRARLLREVLEDMKEEVGDTCAVALRFGVNEIDGDVTQGRELVEMLKDLPDLWDVNISDWSQDSQTSRFAKEGFQEEHVSFVKQVTDKPVVGVGRFTSPDAMVSQVRRGILDLIGAARPSIADPFLPRKIDEGRIDEIRECIGCNICVSGEFSYAPIRCTQNPTMMDEYRRGWHPEHVPPQGSDDAVLVVGAGPAGLECAHVLAKRGYEVTVAEARSELGGRVLRESSLPGLSEWRRVADHRTNALRQLGNVSLFTGSELGADDILGFGAQHVVMATGAHWQRNGTGRWIFEPVAGVDLDHIWTPDDLMDGKVLTGSVLIYDEDGGYLANVLAEKLVLDGCKVTMVTPASEIAPYLALTMEQHRVIPRLLQMGVHLERLKLLSAIDETEVHLECVHGGNATTAPADHVVLLTSRVPDDQMYASLMKRADDWNEAGIRSVSRIGDCEAPGIIATAVHAGHRWARALDNDEPERIASLPEPLN